MAVYTEENLREVIGSVKGLNRAAMTAAEKRQAELAKPPGSLGKLEDISVQLAGITGKVKNRVDKRRTVSYTHLDVYKRQHNTQYNAYEIALISYIT